MVTEARIIKVTKERKEMREDITKPSRKGSGSQVESLDLQTRLNIFVELVS